MNSIEIGEKLRSMREAAGLTAKDVAAQLLEDYGIDMNHRTLFNYEKGRSSPDISRFLALCDLYRSKNVLTDFGYGAYLSKSDGYEDIVLFEDEYTPENWQMIKNFISLVPTKDKK